MATRAAPAALDKEKAAALQAMDLRKIVRAYVQQMVDEVPGYKALLLDKETMRACSTLFGRTELAEHSVFHIERLDGGTEGKDHAELKAVCFMRPTRENVTYLKRELRQPRYQSYHIYFTNLVNQMHLTELAEADAAQEQVQQVQEFYGDFLVVDPHHFTVPVLSNDALISTRSGGSATGVSEYEVTDRCVQGLSALFLALRRRPVIRYQRGSEAAQRLADSLYQLTYRQQVSIFDFGSRSVPLVLLLDRRDDPVTPLLTQWTYQAMIHELLGLRDNVVTLDSPKVAEQYREVVLDGAFDDFYARNLYTNFGEVGMRVRDAVEEFGKKQAAHKQITSLQDMQRFVTEHQDFTKQQAGVSKHVNVMSALSDAVAARGLMEVSTLEQDLANPAAALSASSSYDQVSQVVANPKTADKDRARLVMLYALRFEQESARVRSLLNQLQEAGLKQRSPALMAAAEGILNYAGADKRAGDLYGGSNVLSKARNIFKGLQGVDNVYTQHTPLLGETLGQVQAGTLSPAAYPYMAATQDEAMAWSQQFKAQPPAACIVFILGGSTYEEAKLVAEFNTRQPGGMRVVLGGTTVLNSGAFLSALGMGAQREAPPGGGGSGDAVISVR